MKTAVMVFAAAASVLAPVADAKQARGNGSARFLVEMEDGNRQKLLELMKAQGLEVKA